MPKNKSRKNITAAIIGAVVAVVAGIILIFVAQANKEQIVTYEYEENGVTLSLTFYAKGDRVYKQTTRNIVPYSSLGVKTEAEAREIVDDMLGSSKNINGYSDTVEYEKDHIIETVVVDYDVVSIDEVKDLVGAYFDGDASNGVSLSKTAKLLEESGFKKVE